MARGHIKTIKDLMDACYGPSGRLMVGDILAKTDAPIITSTTGWYTVNYGKKAWLQFNQAANLFGILQKVPWGDDSGWRVVSARAQSSAHGVDTDTAALPDTVKPTVVEVKAEPKFFPTNWNSSIAQQLRSKLGGGMGDIMPWMREHMAPHHAEMINKQLFATAGTVTYQSVDFESLDRIIASFSELSAYEADQSSSFSTDDLDPYSTSLFNRDAGASWVDAQVSHATKGGLRPLTTDLVKAVIRDIRKAGGDTKVIVTGYDTLDKLDGLFESEIRYPMPQTASTPSFNGVSGVPGLKAGSSVAFVYGIPVIPDKDCLADTNGISRMYFLDTDYLKFKTALPTQYFEGGLAQGDPFGLNTFMTEAMYMTAGELVCTNFSVQGKLRDIK